MKEVFVPVLAEKLEALAVKKFNEYIEAAGNDSEMVKAQWGIAKVLHTKLNNYIGEEETKSQLLALFDQISTVSTFESEAAYVAGFLEGMLYYQEIQAIQESVTSAVKEREGYKYT